MTAANAIVTDHLVVDYDTAKGRVRALDHAGLTVEGGGSVAVMGPSGCGKSTLLGLLAGLALPTEGTVTIGDTVVSALSDRARVRLRRTSLGMVYQADNLLPYLTVEENVGLQLAITRREPGAPRDSDAGARDPGALLDRLGLGALATRLPDQLSGGQRQRVAIARAVIHRPSVILADEPTGALDDANAHRVVELLVEAHEELNATLVIVTHDPTVAARVGRIVHLDRAVQPGGQAGRTAHAH